MSNRTLKYSVEGGNLPEGHKGYQVVERCGRTMKRLRDELGRVVESLASVEKNALTITTTSSTYEIEIAVDHIKLDDKKYRGFAQDYGKNRGFAQCAFFYVIGHPDIAYTHFMERSENGVAKAQGLEIFTTQLTRFLEYLESHPSEENYFSFLRAFKK